MITYSSAFIAEFLECANAVYKRTVPLGFRLLTTSDESDLDDGFFAQAFTDGAGRIIIAYEGTQISGDAYGLGSLEADALLAIGQTPNALIHAQAFVEKVLQDALAQNISTDADNVFVTGHSLGGAEAEAAAARYGYGGVTFGAPGISVSKLIAAGGRVDGLAAAKEKLTNFVDYGDLVGNLGTDTKAGDHYTPPGVEHIGQPRMVGNVSDGDALPSLDQLILNTLSSRLRFTNLSIPGALATLGVLVADLVVFAREQLSEHYLNVYASDLNFSFLTDGSGLVVANGPVGPVAPANSSYDLILSSFPYSSFSSVQSSSGKLQQLTINETDNSSNIINFDLTNEAWLLSGDTYNSSGQLACAIKVNDDYSEKQTIYNTSGGLLNNQSFYYDASGNLTAISFTFTNGNAITLDTGTYTDIDYDSSTDALTATLMANGMEVGALSLNASGGGTVSLYSGWSSPEVFNVTGTGDMHLAAAPADTSTVQALANYLTQLGLPMTAAQLSEYNDSYLCPSASPTTIQGTLSQSDGQVIDRFFSHQNNAIITGPTSVVYNGVTVTPYNILEAMGVMTQDSISNIQELQVKQAVYLTGDQFNSFQKVRATDFWSGMAVLYIVGGGSVTVDAQTAGFTVVRALGWEGTTIEGSGRLMASMYGNDTLIGQGNGSLFAGMGVNTLIGGDDTYEIVAQFGLAAGSSVQGGDNTILSAAGDISGASITGISKFDICNLDSYFLNGPPSPSTPRSVTLSSAQFDAFDSITSTNGSLSFVSTLILADGGTYDLRSKIPTGSSDNQFNIAAGSNNGTVLIGTDADSISITASQFGDDTLQAGNGNDVVLIGGGGNDILISGAGSNNMIGGSGYMTYRFSPGFGQDAISNASGTPDAPQGEIDFEAGISRANLWFGQSGYNLVITLLGTSDTIEVINWFHTMATGAQLQAIKTADGLQLSTAAIEGLVTEMATYQAAHTGFDPTTATSMPTDMQTAITNAWTSSAAAAGVSVDAATANQTDLGNIGRGYKVVDTATNVMGGMSFLTSEADHIVSIQLTDETLPAFAMTGTQYAASSVVLDKIVSAYSLSIIDVTAADAATMPSQAYNTTISVSDTAENVVANIDALQDLASVGSLGSITLTDSTTPTLSLTATQLTSDTAALAKITNAYNLSISGGGTTTMGDGLTGIQTVNLQSASSAYIFTANDLAGLVITDGSATDDTLTAGDGGNTFIAGAGNDTLNGGDAYNIYKFSTGFGQDIINNASGGSMTAKGEVEFLSGTTSRNLWFTQSGDDLIVTLLGTADAIALTGWFGSNAGARVEIFKAEDLQLNQSAVEALVSAMATYQAAHADFDPTTATDMPTDSALQAALATAWPDNDYVDVTVAYAQANQTALDAHSGGYTVADTAANVTAGLSFLASDASHIASITLTDGSTPTLSLTTTQLTTGAEVLAKIVGAFNLSVSGGGTVTLGSGIANVNTITLQTAASAYNFTGNDTAGLIIKDAASTSDTITAGNGGNTLYDIEGGSTLNGGAGQDTFYAQGSSGGTVINGGAGDSVNLSNSTTVADTVNMSGGTITASQGAKAIVVGSDNDITVNGDATLTIGTSSSNSAGNNVTVNGNNETIYINGDGNNTIAVSGASTNVVAITNYSSGNSKKVLYNLSSTISSQVQNWTGANATGTLGSRIDNLTAGGSDLYTFDSSGAVTQVAHYTEANASGTITSLTLNWADGTSQVRNYNPSSDVIERDYNYAGPNGTGTLNTIYINWSNGTSQRRVLNPGWLPAGISEQIFNYNGPNLTGAIESQVNNLTAGGSDHYAFYPNGSVSQITHYTEANATGTVANRTLNWVDNCSQVRIYNPSSSTVEVDYNYASTNGTGTLNTVYINWFGGGSQKQIWNPGWLPSGVSEQIVNYGGAGQTGFVISQINNLTAGGSNVTVSRPSGSPSHTYNWGDGTSQLVYYNPSSEISEIRYNYAGANGTGALNTAYINWTAGGSQAIVFASSSWLPSNTTQKALNYSSAYQTGDLLSTVYTMAPGNDGSVTLTNATLNMCSNSQLTISGTGNTINGASGDTITVAAGSSVAINGSNLNIVAAAGDTIALNGVAGTNHITGSGAYTLILNGVNKGSGTHFGTYGFAGSVSAVATALDPDSNIIIQNDLANGDTAGAEAAKSSLEQIQALIDNRSNAIVLEGAVWSDKTITWNVADGALESATYQNEIEQAFDVWSRATGLTFKEVSGSSQADIYFSLADFNTSTSGVVGFTTYAVNDGQMQNASILLEDPGQGALMPGNKGQLTYTGTDATLLQVLEHEIGHSLGFADNANAGSIMNYYLGSQNQTLSDLDIAAAQELYGVDTQIAQLVQAMASYQSAPSGCEAVTASAIRMDATEQNAIAPNGYH